MKKALKTLAYCIGLPIVGLAFISTFTQAMSLVRSDSDVGVAVGIAILGLILGVGALTALFFVHKFGNLDPRKILGPLALLLLVTGSGCTRVEPGYVGILVNNYGQQRGPEDFPVKTGRVTYNPFTQDLYKFPTFLQSVVWTQANTEGSPNDDSITFNAKGGFSLNADIALSYGFMAEKVPHLFVEFRQSADAITHVYMRSQVRNAFATCASTRDPISLMGEGRAEFETCVKAMLNTALNPKGFYFDMVSIIGRIRVDEKLQNSINAVLAAKQAAAEAEQKIAQSRAEAEQKIQEARGQAAAITEVAKAQAEANRVVRESLDEKMIQWQALQKWDGRMPQVTGGGATPFINIPQGGNK